MAASGIFALTVTVAGVAFALIAGARRACSAQVVGSIGSNEYSSTKDCHTGWKNAHFPLAGPGVKGPSGEERIVYQCLLKSKGKTLGYACDDADYWFKQNFMKHVDKLHQDGWIEVKKDRMVLCAKPPGSALEWLARCAD